MIGFESAGFVVGNAAESEIFGFETDFTVALTDQVTVNGALAYLDTEYKDYTTAPCTIMQLEDGSCAANGGFQDLSGTELQFSPECGFINAKNTCCFFTALVKTFKYFEYITLL